MDSTKLESTEVKKLVNVDSIESVIKQHEPLFLSYWGGMSEREVNIVTEYLLLKNEVGLIKEGEYLFWNFNTTQRTYKLQVFILTNPFCTKHPDKLHSVGIELYDLQNKSNFSHDDYSEIIKMYQKKYGKPIQHKFSKPKKKNPKKLKLGAMEDDETYYFKNDITLISVSFNDNVDHMRNCFPLNITYTYMPFYNVDQNKKDLNEKVINTQKEL
jgi:hypothetical protein